MTREQKYPTTRTFQFYNANPKNRIAGDCVIRAISTATRRSWDDTYRGLFEVGFKAKRSMTEKDTYTAYLTALGWLKMPQPKREDGTKFTGDQFCRLLQAQGWTGRMVAHIGGHHVVAIVNGKVLDHWNSANGCIGNYWIEDGTAGPRV